MLLTALLCVGALMAQSQNLTFKNTSSCTLYAILMADHSCTPTAPGPNYYQSHLVAIPAGAITTFNINTFALWNGATPTLTGEHWLGVKLYGNLLCSTNVIWVGACPGFGTTAMMPMDGSCNNCQQVTGEWSQNGTNYHVSIR